MATILGRNALKSLALILAAFFPAAAVAECPPPPPTSSLAEGEIGLFFDPAGTTTCGDPVQAGFTTLYVVARVPEGGIGWFEIPRVLAPAFQLIDEPALPSGSPYLQSHCADCCEWAEQPDESTCPAPQGDVIVIAEVHVFTTGGESGTACFQTACSSIAGPIARAPVYGRCGSAVFGDEQFEFRGGDFMCIGFGEAPLALEKTTWGTIKSVYR